LPAGVGDRGFDVPEVDGAAGGFLFDGGREYGRIGPTVDGGAAFAEGGGVGESLFAEGVDRVGEKQPSQARAEFVAGILDDTGAERL